MRNIFCSLGVICLLGGCGGSTGTNTDIVPPTITSINTAPLNNNFSQPMFSIYIDLTSRQTIANWKFGFYVPRTLYKYVAPDPAESAINANTGMIMQVCQMPGATSCVAMEYLKANSVTDPDLSAGYTSLLAPVEQFPLVAGNNYEIQIINNNQWGMSNLSSAPQNLFFLVNSQVLNVSAESSIYNLNVNESANQVAIAAYNQNNWSSYSNLNQESTIIVPSVVNYTAGSGNYTLASGVVIHNVLSGDNTVANFFSQDLTHDLGITASVDNSSTATTGIIITPIGANQGVIESNPEGYQMTIAGDNITIKAMNNTGAFYALQSLRQLWSAGSGVVAQATITDYPRFSYRGVLLDSSRHFFSAGEVESLIDIMAMHKLNTLHWHLSDDEGSRIDMGLLIPGATTGAIANTRGYGNSMTGMMFLQGNLDPSNYLNQVYPHVDTNYHGVYSKADIENIIAYANARGITVIPEIDSPGHARALVKAFPQILVDPNDHSSYLSVQGYTDNAFPVCTYKTGISVGAQFTSFYDGLYNNLNSLFNGQTTLYAIANEVSIGGDEVAAQTWYTPQDSSCVQNSEFALLSSLEKEHLFFKKFAQNNPSLIVSGWQQFIQTEESQLGVNIVPANQVGHVWVWNSSTSGLPQVKNLSEAGYPVVLDYSNDTYFDLTYTQSIYEPGFYWAGNNNTYTALKSAVDATTTINAINSSYQKNVKGIEGTLWSENIPTYQHLIYMALPKMSGLAEASWSPATITNGSGGTAQYPNWQSLAHRLGCGQMTSSPNYPGFLSYLSNIFGVHYRGYPNGIYLEAQWACN